MEVPSSNVCRSQQTNGKIGFKPSEEALYPKDRESKQDKAIMLWKKMKFTEGEHAKQGETAAGEDKVSKSTYS